MGKVETTWRTMKLTELNPAEYNPREITDDALIGLKNSLEEFGLVQNLVWNRRTGDLVGGHQRMKVMIGEGITKAMICVVDLSRKREKALNIALNNPHIAGTFDGGLQSLLEEIRDDDVHLFRDVYLDKLLTGESLGTLPDDVAPEPPKNPVTKPGDIWTMGDHRIICGDCRNIDDVKKLLGDSKINVAFTSPPYASQRKYDESSGFKPIRPDDYVEWFRDVQANVAEFLAEDGSFFVNIKAASEGLDTQTYVLDLALTMAKEWGWHLASEFCWERSGIPGKPRRRFKNQFEPVYQFAMGEWKFRPELVMHGSDSVMAYSPENRLSNGLEPVAGQGGGNWKSVEAGMAYPGNRLKCGNTKALGHSATFPIGLPEFFIKAYSDTGDLIFDPFMGSGTTMIAAQKNGRRSAGCEISPAYCDVIVERWESLTGGKSTR